MHAYVHICAYLCTHIGTINLLDYYVDQDKASTDPQMLVLRAATGLAEWPEADGQP